MYYNMNIHYIRLKTNCNCSEKSEIHTIFCLLLVRVIHDHRAAVVNEVSFDRI